LFQGTLKTSLSHDTPSRLLINDAITDGKLKTQMCLFIVVGAIIVQCKESNRRQCPDWFKDDGRNMRIKDIFMVQSRQEL